MAAEKEFNRDPIEHTRLEDLIDRNRPLYETFKAFPTMYYVLEDRWEYLLELLGIPIVSSSPEITHPYWVDFEGALIWRLPRRFLKHIPNPSEVYTFEIPMLNFEGSGLVRPQIPQEDRETAFYIRWGELIICEPGDPRPGDGRCKAA